MERLRQSPTDDQFVQNPYPFYDRALRAGPFIYWEDYNLPCATDYNTVNALLRNRKFGREIPEDKRQPIPEHLKPFYAVEQHSMLELEAPRHPRLRGLVLRAFTSRRIMALESELKTLCHDLIDDFKSPVVDLLPAYCQRIPVIVICRLLGVPEDMADQLL